MRILQASKLVFILLILGAAGFFLFHSEDIYEGSSSPASHSGTERPGLVIPEQVVGAAASEVSPAPPRTSDESINIRVYGQVSPGVVNITSRVVEYDFFFEPVVREGSSGSGSIIDRDGNIVTNYHVVKGAEQLEVTLPDQSKWQATVVGVDPDNDLAVIQIKAPTAKLRPVAFGDSTVLRVGQKVLAIGNPFRLHNTLTAGIISSLGRTIRAPNGTFFEDIIQTDAGLNPGNSGGPLLNSAGEMIGVNTLIFSPSGGNIGLGFAIPSSKVKQITADLLRYGQVRRPVLGISDVYTLNADLAKLLRLPVSRGVLVARVLKDGPADRGGIRGGNRRVRLFNTSLVIGGDIIVGANGKSVASVEDLKSILEDSKPGQRMNLEILRGNRRRTLAVTLGSSVSESRRRY